MQNPQVDDLECALAAAARVELELKEMGIGFVVAVVVAECGRSSQGHDPDHPSRLRLAELGPAEAVAIDRHPKRIAGLGVVVDPYLAREILRVAPPPVAM